MSQLDTTLCIRPEPLGVPNPSIPALSPCSCGARTVRWRRSSRRCTRASMRRSRRRKAAEASLQFLNPNFTHDILQLRRAHGETEAQFKALYRGKYAPLKEAHGRCADEAARLRAGRAAAADEAEKWRAQVRAHSLIPPAARPAARPATCSWQRRPFRLPQGIPYL